MLWEVIRIIIVFPLVIILLLFTLKSIQKLSGPVVTNRQMKMVERLRLSQKTNLSIVKIGEQYLVISCSDEQFQIIRELTLAEVAKLEEKQQVPQLEKFDIANWKDTLSRWKREKAN